MNTDSIILCNCINNEIKDYLCSNNFEFRLQGLRNPDNTKVQEISSLIGTNVNYDLNKIGNHIYKVVSPPCLNLKDVAVRLSKCIDILKSLGKSQNAINNIYFRFLCWMHFDFIDLLKGKYSYNIVYSGNLDINVLMMLYIIRGIGLSVCILSNSAFDTELLTSLGVVTYDGTGESISDNLNLSQELDNFTSLPRANYIIGTNTWLKGDTISEIFTPYNQRVSDLGSDGIVTKSALIMVEGVEDKTSYLSNLYNYYLECRYSVSIINTDFGSISPNDITDLRQKFSSQDFNKYILNLFSSLSIEKNVSDILVLEVSKLISGKKNKEYLLLEIFHILSSLIRGYNCSGRYYLYFMQTKEITEVQSYIFYLLSCIMFDVVIFNPSKIVSSVDIKYLYTMHYNDTLTVNEFPITPQSVVIETVAYRAESDLTDLLYDGSAGIYRDNQFNATRVVYLKPMYEEIDILWNEDVSLRQGFSVSEGVVTIPTIFAEIKGAKSESSWCKHLFELTKNQDNVLYNKETSLFVQQDSNIFSGEVIRNKSIDIALLKSHKFYPYSYLSLNTQNYMISKLNELLNSGVLKGVYTHGIENIILKVFVSLNSNEKLVRMIQNFDFTKVSPKVCYTWMSRDKIPLEDVILLHYLNMLGFDILVLVPTSYNVFDNFLDKRIYTEYVNGSALEPFTVKFNFSQVIFNKIFKNRGM